jgi:hypothetical protein
MGLRAAAVVSKGTAGAQTRARHEKGIGLRDLTPYTQERDDLVLAAASMTKHKYTRTHL